MAEGIRYICSSCGRAIQAWSDGNPYYLDEKGQKQYAYHPDHERLSRCIGNDTPHLCLRCGVEFQVDSLNPVKHCPDCGSTEFAPTFRLEGSSCPYCQEGTFHRDEDYFAIS